MPFALGLHWHNLRNPIINHPPFPTLYRMVALLGLVAAGMFAAGLEARGAVGDEVAMGSPVVIPNAQGELEIFRVDNRGEMYHKCQKKDSGDWSPWVSLGGWLFPEIALVMEPDGRLEVFAVDERKRLRYKWQADAIHTSWDWSGWTTVGAETDAFRPPAAIGQNQDGRVEVFALDANRGVVRHIWRTQLADGWSEWAEFPGKVEPGFVVGTNKDGRMELFAIASPSGDLIHCYQTEPNTNLWSAWSNLHGCLLPQISLVQNADGRLEILGVSRTNAAVEHIYQIAANATNNWSAWSALGGNLKAGFAVGQRANGCLEIFAVNAITATLLHIHQTKPGNSESWSGWKNLGGSVQSPPAVGQNRDGNLEVFANDSEHPATLHHRRQVNDNTGWLDWLNMDQPVFQYAARIWQTGEGLPQNEVQAIAQTPNGYLWIGTRDGLARFDGINFFSFDSKNTPEIKNNSILALCVDRAGTLWVGTEGGGLACLKGRLFSHYSQADGLAGDHVNAIHEGNDGSLWIGTSEGLSHFEDGKFSNITKQQGLLSNQIRSICEDQDANLWIATDQGLNRWNHGVKDSFTTADGLPNNSLRAIYFDFGGRLWIGTDNGIAWYDGGKFYSHNIQSGLADRIVSAVCRDRRGSFWVGTYGGLNRFQEGSFLTELNSEGLPFDRVNAVFEDREGNLWVGSKEGLIRFTPKRFFSYTKRQGLTHNDIRSVMEDRVRNLWIGTWGGGLEKLRGEWVYPFRDFTNDYVLSLCEARDEGVWIGADFDGGLTRFLTNSFKQYTWKDGLIRSGLKVMHEDLNTNLWIGTSKGLCLFKNEKFTSYTVQDGLAGDNVRAICEDSSGTLWFGTDHGLSAWKDGKFKNYTARDGLGSDSVTALFEDSERTLWIGTEAGGLTHFSQGRFTVYTTRQGLFSDEIFEILEDDYGWMWMSCSKGVFRVRKNDFEKFENGRATSIASISYGRADGMESMQCNGTAKPGAWKTQDGTLWFATTKGIVGVDPRIEIQEVPPPVFVEELVADNRPVLLGVESGRASGGLSAIRTAGSNAGSASVPAGRGQLEFHYTALNFQTPEKSRFRYKLENVDLNWVEADQRRVAHYNNIYPGSYRFHVIACNSDGVWNKTGASLSVVVRPHFWQTWYFFTIITLACIGAVYGVARYITKARMQRKLALLQHQHALERERGRIAKDIHDELGSSLTRIMMLGERAQEDLDQHAKVDFYIKKIMTSATQTVQALDEIVWAVDPESDTLDGLVAYINQYANQFFENTNVNCRLEMPIEFSNIHLSAEIRHDLFLAVKEALNNLLKHAQASEVHVQITQLDSTVKIVIQDNGCGFDPSKITTGRKGHGLENMRKRIDGLGGRLTITSVCGQGTTLTLIASLQTPGNRITS